MYDDNSTGGPEKYTKEQFQKMERERFAAEARENAERDKEKAQEKARARAVENAEYADKRQPKSDLIRQAELDKMKEILKMPKSGGGGGGGGMPKLNRDLTKNYKSGGKVSSASKRADGCAVKGKTRGRMV
jgi:hypothetical protein